MLWPSGAACIGIDAPKVIGSWIGGYPETDHAGALPVVSFVRCRKSIRTSQKVRRVPLRFSLRHKHLIGSDFSIIEATYMSMAQLSCIPRRHAAQLDIDDRKPGTGSDVTTLQRPGRECPAGGRSMQIRPSRYKHPASTFVYCETRSSADGRR